MSISVCGSTERLISLHFTPSLIFVFTLVDEGTLWMIGALLSSLLCVTMFIVNVVLVGKAVCNRSRLYCTAESTGKSYCGEYWKTLLGVSWP